MAAGATAGPEGFTAPAARPQSRLSAPGPVSVTCRRQLSLLGELAHPTTAPKDCTRQRLECIVRRRRALRVSSDSQATSVSKKSLALWNEIENAHDASNNMDDASELFICLIYQF